jgi:hypothetical protein
MSNNSNYNHNEHDGSDNNEQSASRVHGGELRNGRLSRIKNHNPQDGDTPNEYISTPGIPGMDE